MDRAEVAEVGSMPLTLADAVQSWSLPGNGNGLAVDSAGNVFFAVNDSVTGDSTLGMLDANAPSGYDTIYTSPSGDDFFGAISVDGNFLKGGTLYFNPGIGYANSIAAIEVVAEPGTLALLAVAGVRCWPCGAGDADRIPLPEAAHRARPAPPPTAKRLNANRFMIYCRCKTMMWTAIAWGLTAGAGAAGPYPPAGGQPGAVAVSATSSSISEWAGGYTIDRGLAEIDNPSLGDATYGGTNGSGTSQNNAPLGEPPQPPSSSYAIALGQGGTVTLTFAQPITNGPGYDFAVFGNGFPTGTLEWVKPAFVEVSSDGVNFFRFPAVSLTPTTTQVLSYGELDPTNLYDLAGKDPAGYGTPFDLSELAGVSPLLNINDVTEVRIVDCVDDINPAYASYDSQGNIINGPWPASSLIGSEGFDLAGVGAINVLASGTWTGGASTSWANGKNWCYATVPNSGTVTFAGLPTSPTTITLDGNQSAAALNFNVSGSNGYALSPGSGGALTLGTSTGASITVISGTNLISAPLILAGSATISLSDGTELAITGDISESPIDSGFSMALSGGGTLVLSGSNSYTGSTDVDAGTLCVTEASARCPMERP